MLSGMHRRAALLVLPALLLAACGDDAGDDDDGGSGSASASASGSASGPDDGAGDTSEVADGDDAGTCEALAIDAAQDLGTTHFPDNHDVTWDVLGTTVADDDEVFVEVQPTPDEVGYPRFTFLVECDDGTPELVATYALEDGAYVLLSTTGDTDPDDVPATPPG